MLVQVKKKSLCLELGVWEEAGCISAEYAAVPFMFGMRGGIASFFCLEVLEQVGEMPILMLKLQF